MKSPNYGTTSVQTLKFLRTQGGKANGGGPGLIVSPSREVHVPKYLVAEGLRNPHLEFSTKYSVLSSPRVPQLGFQPWAQLVRLTEMETLAWQGHMSLRGLLNPDGP